MCAVIQRVLEASVSVDEKTVAAIGNGLMVLLGVEQGDSQDDVKYMAEKTIGLRVFSDDAGLMNLNVVDRGGAILVVSQFTLLGDVRRGRRPSFTAAAPPSVAIQLYDDYCQQLSAAGVEVGQGVFQADMRVALVNDGPVTILLDSRKTF